MDLGEEYHWVRCSYYRIIEGGVWYQQGLLLIVFALIPWLQWYLPPSSTIMMSLVQLVLSLLRKRLSPPPRCVCGVHPNLPKQCFPNPPMDCDPFAGHKLRPWGAF